MPAVLNAANEIAVHAFLDDKIPFYMITEAVCNVVDEMAHTANKHTLSQIIDCDREARERAKIYLGL